MSNINLGNYFEIKHTIAHMIISESESIYFYDNDSNLVVFDDIPANYPRWTFTILTEAEMVENIIRMIDEGWNLLSIDDEFVDKIK